MPETRSLQCYRRRYFKVARGCRRSVHQKIHPCLPKLRSPTSECVGLKSFSSSSEASRLASRPRSEVHVSHQFPEPWLVLSAAEAPQSSNNNVNQRKLLTPHSFPSTIKPCCLQVCTLSLHACNGLPGIPKWNFVFSFISRICLLSYLGMWARGSGRPSLD